MFVEKYEAENPAKKKETSAQASQEQLLKDLEIKHKQKLTDEAKLTPLLQSIVDLRSVSKRFLQQFLQLCNFSVLQFRSQSF